MEYGSPGNFSFIHLPFAHRANRSLSFVRLLKKKQMKVLPFTNGLKRLNGINRLAYVCLQTIIEKSSTHYDPSYIYVCLTF
jgi:hypothetical protein